MSKKADEQADTSRRAMDAARQLSYRTAFGLSAETGLSASLILRAGQILRCGAPELIAAVDDGTVSVSAGGYILHLPVERQREVVAEGLEAVRREGVAARDKRRDARILSHNERALDQVSPLAGMVIRDLIMFRHSAGLSQRDVAVRLGIVQTAVAAFEAGHRNPRLMTVARYAHVCGAAIEVRFYRDQGLVFASRSGSEQVTIRLIDDIADYFTTYRVSARLSQSGLAARVGVHRSSFTAYENGRRDPYISLLDKFATGCDMHLEVKVVAADNHPNARPALPYDDTPVLATVEEMSSSTESRPVPTDPSLSASQRAIYAARFAGGGRQRVASVEWSVSRRLVQVGMAVLEQGCQELIDLVEKDDIAVHAAYELLQLAHGDQRTICGLGPDYVRRAGYLLRQRAEKRKIDPILLEQYPELAPILKLNGVPTRFDTKAEPAPEPVVTPAPIVEPEPVAPVEVEIVLVEPEAAEDHDESSATSDTARPAHQEPDTDNLLVGWLIKEITKARIRNGLSQNDVAARLNTNQPYVSHFERGVGEPDLQKLLKYAGAADAIIEIKFFRARPQVFSGRGGTPQTDKKLIASLRDFLAQLRNDAAMTMVQLSQRTGVSTIVLSGHERTAPIRIPVLEAYAEAFDLRLVMAVKDR